MNGYWDDVITPAPPSRQFVGLQRNRVNSGDVCHEDSLYYESASGRQRRDHNDTSGQGHINVHVQQVKTANDSLCDDIEDEMMTPHRDGRQFSRSVRRRHMGLIQQPKIRQRQYEHIAATAGGVRMRDAECPIEGRMIVRQPWQRCHGEENKVWAKRYARTIKDSFDVYEIPDDR